MEGMNVCVPNTGRTTPTGESSTQVENSLLGRGWGEHIQEKEVRDSPRRKSHIHTDHLKLEGAKTRIHKERRTYRKKTIQGEATTESHRVSQIYWHTDRRTRTRNKRQTEGHNIKHIHTGWRNTYKKTHTQNIHKSRMGIQKDINTYTQKVNRTTFILEFSLSFKWIRVRGSEIEYKRTGLFEWKRNTRCRCDLWYNKT